MDRHPDRKTDKETVDLNNTRGQLDLTDIYNFYPTAEEYTFFSSAHGIFSMIDHMLGHKTTLNKFNKIEIISCIFWTTME